MQGVTFVTILIALQACITSAVAQNEVLNSLNKIEHASAQEFTIIKQEKTHIDANLKKQEAACYKKFAVNNCLKDAKHEAQTALSVVKRREIAINDLQRNAKAESDQRKREKTTPTNNAENSGVDKTSEDKYKIKKLETTKSVKVIKSDAVIASEKNASDKSRIIAAQKRLADSNEKIAASTKKAEVKAIKNSQAGANIAKYKQKLFQAEKYKANADKSRLLKSSQLKPPSAPLPVPNAAELAR